MDEEDGGILSIDISDNEHDAVKRKADRTGQTEEEFQAVKRSYRARVENGDVGSRAAIPGITSFLLLIRVSDV